MLITFERQNLLILFTRVKRSRISKIWIPIHSPRIPWGVPLKALLMLPVLYPLPLTPTEWNFSLLRPPLYCIEYFHRYVPGEVEPILDSLTKVFTHFCNEAWMTLKLTAVEIVFVTIARVTVLLIYHDLLQWILSWAFPCVFVFVSCFIPSLLRVIFL